MRVMYVITQNKELINIIHSILLVKPHLVDIVVIHCRHIEEQQTNST